MTWETQGPATPQDPQAPGAQQPPGQQPPAYPPPGQAPPAGQQPPAYPPPGQAPPPGQQPQGGDPWAGQQPPGGDPWAGQQPPGQQPQGGDPWAGQRPPGQQPPGPPPPPPGSPYGPPVAPEPMWRPPPAYPLAPDAYPVNVSYDREAHINRLWGIPLIGQLVRWILLIPHFIVLLLVGIVAALMFLVTWIPVLLLGRFPGWGYRWIGGFLAYQQRVTAYALLMTPTYPPFALESDDYPITVRYDEGVRIFRLWGIPIIGHLVRLLVLIPHFIVLWVLGILAWFLAWVLWVPVLVLGRQADLVYTIMGGFYRWQLRVTAYLFMMVDRYPPFSLGEDDPRL